MNKAEGTKLLNNAIAELNQKQNYYHFSWYKNAKGFILLQTKLNTRYKVVQVGHIYNTKTQRKEVLEKDPSTQKVIFTGKGSQLLEFILNFKVN